MIVTVLRTKATPKAPLTAREVADATGLKPPIVHGVLASLTKQGVAQLIKRSTGRKSYALADAGNSAAA
jgi:DNA-binding MarR family transcriptional regulator